MNKLLIVLLAVCLVSVHAFVKRDAPATEPSDIMKTFEQMKNNVANATTDLAGQVVEQAAKLLDPENIKNNFENFAEKTKEFIDKLKPTEEVKPEA